MADKIGSAYVEVNADTSPAAAAFKKLQADADRTMAELGRKKAELEINAKTVEFDREIDKVKTEIDNLKRKKASITIEADTKQLDADIAEAEAELKSLTGKKRKITIDSRDLRNTNRDAALLSKTMAVNEKLALDTAKANDRLAASRQRDSDAVLKSRVELDKLSATYEKLAGQRQKLQRSSRGVFSGRSIAQSEQEARSLSRVGNELELTKHRIESLGGSVEGLDPALNKDRNRLENWFTSLSKVRLSLGPISGSLKQFGIAAGLLGPILFEVGGGLLSLVGVAGTAFTGAMAAGSAAAAGFGLSALGVGLILKPVIGEIKAATDASTAYQKAVLKYGKDSTQAKTAQEELGHTLKGISPGARAAIKSFGGLKTTWTKLTAAAKKPIFDAAASSINTVKALLPSFARESVATTKVATKGWEDWMKALRSPGAKSAIDQIMGNFRQSLPSVMSGLQALGTTIGHIATAASSFLPGLSSGFNSWAQSIEKAVGSGAQLEGKIGRLIGHMRDVGHLAQASGKFLVGFFNASADSGDNLTKSLTGTINKWNAWMKTTHGQNSLKSFFSESEGATKDFFSSLAHLATLIFQISRATAPLANGFLKVVTFIGNVVTAADKLVGVKNIVQGLGYVFGALFVASKVIAYGEAISGVLVKLGLMEGATTADVGATEALTAATAELTAAMTAEAAAAGEVGAALGAEGLAADGAAAESGLAAAGAGAAGVEGSLAGAADGAGLLSAALAPEVLIPAGLIGGLALLIGGLGEVETAWDKTQKAFHATANNIPDALHHIVQESGNYTDAQRAVEKANAGVAGAQKRVLKLFREDAPIKKQTAAAIALTDAEKQQRDAVHNVGVQNETTIKQGKTLVHGAEERLKTARAALKVGREEKKEAVRQREIGFNGEAPEKRAAALKKLAGTAFGIAHAEREVAQARGEVAHANNIYGVSMIPVERSANHLKALLPETEQGLQKLSKTIGASATQKIGNFVDPKQVQQITALGNHLDKLGRGTQVKNVAVKSSGADETLNKLQALQKQTKNVEGHTAHLTVKSNDSQANASLKRVAALSQRVTGSKNTIKILANSSSAEQALARLRAHLEGVAKKKYEATISAVDKTQPGWEAAYHKLRETASKKYEASITAVDKASGVAKKAEGGAKKAAGGHYQANITANAAQASATIGFVEGQLAGLNGKTANTYVVTHYTHTGSPSGHYSGGPGAYVPFAAGGMSDQQTQRAYNQAGEERAGPSRKVIKPTMLVGEQPAHPEYVVATNPAYRADNERYLGQAADDLGYELVPAYAKGKGGKKGGHPPKGLHAPGYYIKHDTFAPRGVHQINTEEQHLQELEHEYSKEEGRQGALIAAGKIPGYDLGWFKQKLSAEIGVYETINHTLIPNVLKSVKSAIASADHTLKGTASPKAIRAAEKDASQAHHHYSNAEKQKNESTHDYNKRKNHLQKIATEKDNAATKLKTERKNALKIKNEAKAEAAELRHAQRENVVSREELQTKESFELPGYGETQSASTAPTPGEETATLSAEREKLFNEYGSNISGYGGAAAGTVSPAVAAFTGAAQQVVNSSVAGATAAAVRGVSAAGLGTNAYSSGSEVAKGDTTIVNNFAAPPPDPHTWVKQQQFSFQAVAA